MKEQAIRNTIGIVGNIISFCLFLSPLPTFFRIIKKRAVEEFKPDPYMATVMNCALWVFYGMPFVHPHSILVITINAVGLAIEFVYITIFVFFATSQGRKKVGYIFLVEFILLAIVIFVTLLALHGTKKRSLLVGIIADVFNVLMYFSPLTVVKKVIKTRSVKYMPFWLSLANFFNGCVWTAYAIMHPLDIFVLISNCVGVISGAGQLTIYGYFYFFGAKDDIPNITEEEVEDKSKNQNIELPADLA